MKVAVLGATKGMGRALARRMAQRGDAVALLGRDQGDLERSARDLEVRGGARVGTALCDLERPETFAPALEKAEAALGGLDTVVVTAGLFYDNPAAVRQRLQRFGLLVMGIAMILFKVRSPMLVAIGMYLPIFKLAAVVG